VTQGPYRTPPPRRGVAARALWWRVLLSWRTLARWRRRAKGACRRCTRLRNGCTERRWLGREHQRMEIETVAMSEDMAHRLPGCPLPWTRSPTASFGEACDGFVAAVKNAKPGLTHKPHGPKDIYE
jgi:hypothetical protein